ncbi:MAG: 50S ribosomal protein L4 [Candidatus Margulisbacteria bacterium]|nr:50S ribosomal protein L4 [Candidatus Margulisiibacteriota bacterium]
MIDIKGSIKGKEPFNIELPSDTERSLVHQLFKFQRAKFQQGTASAKTRSQVRGGGAKPYRQKGTGRARRGTSRSPLIRGGGVIFPPSPRDFSIRLTKKVIRSSLLQLMALILPKVKVLQVDDSVIKTKALASIMPKKSKKAVFIITNMEDSIALACRNIQGVSICHPGQLDANVLMSADVVYIPSKELKNVEEALK